MTASAVDERPDVPSGTVTFLYTDIEGSTRLLETLREGYALVLADQRDLLRAAFAHCHGHEIDTQGDAFFVAFPRALDALQCVVEAQRALAGHAWPAGVQVRVRMGLHTGEPIIGRTGYVGMDVHRAARISAAGHGGQVLVSQTTRELIYQDLPSGVALRALGDFKLKDIRFAQTLYQLDIDGLPVDFPPLKTLSSGEEPPAPGQPPFQGLRYFDVADAEQFFGRDELTLRLLDALCAQRFLAIIGASGSGKSSIVRAGLVPALRGAGRLGDRRPARCAQADWQIHLLTPTAHPLEALATSLTSDSESVSAAATLLDDLRRDPRSLHLWVRRFKERPQFSRPAEQETRLLLIVDQFEELFTLCRDPDERRAFVDNLMLAAEAEGGATTLVISLRADFYEHLAAYPGLCAAVAKHQDYLGAMTAAELRQAMEAPAAQAGWEFSPGLVELLLHDVGADAGRQPEPGALPLLSHALLETWKRRRGNLLNLKAYSESGGVRGAIAHTAERVFYQELTPAQQTIARGIFLRLTELGEGTQDTRRRASYAELLPPEPQGDPAQVRDVLARLADARLIITGDDTVEVAHEALIREWPTLRGWLDADRDGLRLHRHLTEAAQAWADRQRDPAELYRGARLAQAVEWASVHPGELNNLEREFLEAARGLAEREAAEREAAHQRELAAVQHLAETQTRAARQLRRRAVFLYALLVVAVVAALAAGLFARSANLNATSANQSLSTAEAAAQGEANARATEQSLARANADRVEAQRLAAASANVAAAAGNPELIALLALRSMILQYTPQGDAALQAAAALDYPLRLLPRGRGSIFETQFSPDGRYVGTSSWDPTQVTQDVTVWDSQSGSLVQSFPYPSYGRLAFSPDSTQVAICSADMVGSTTGRVEVRQAATGQLVRQFITDACGAPPQWLDSQTLVVGIDNTVQSLDVSTGAAVTQWTTDNTVLLVSPRAQYALVTATALGGELGGEDTVELWNLVKASASLTIPSSGGIWGEAFSPDGTYLALGLADKSIKVWQTGTLTVAATLSGHTALVGSLAFSPDGQYLLSGSDDQTARLWRVDGWQEVRRWSGSEANVGGVTFSPDGRLMATGTRLEIATGGDGTARLWSLQPQPEWPMLGGQNGIPVGVAFSPDGGQLATAGSDQVVRLWDIHTGQTIRAFPGTGNVGLGLRFSRDGRQVLVGTDAGAATLWDTSTGAQLWQTRPPGMASLYDVAFSPDGASIVLVGASTASSETYAVIVDARSGAELRRLTIPNANNAASVDYSPDGHTIALTTVDGHAWLGDAQTGQILRQVGGDSGLFVSVRFSPDGQYLVAASADKTARLLEAATGQEVRRFIGHTQGLSMAAFSPDGQLIATASHDGTVRVWQTATGQELRRYAADAQAVENVAWSPDGKRLASTGDDTTTKLWDVNDQDTIAYLCGRLKRDFTDAERAQFNISDASPTCPS